MKSLSTIFALTLTMYLGAQVDIPQDSLVAYFIGMDTNGLLDDVVGYNDGIAGNQPLPTADRFGSEGCAVLFDGGDSYFFSQNLDAVNADGPFSISLWYQGGSDEVGDYESMVAKPPSPNIDVQSGNYNLGLHDLNKVVMGSDQNHLWMEDDDAPELPANDEWHHLVAVYDTALWTMYFDNEVISQESTGELGLTTQASDLFIGFSFEGALDDIALYHRALTAIDVDALYTAPGQCGTVLSIDETAIVNDISLYPNPVSDELFVDLSGQKYDGYMITDMSGRTIRSGQPLLSSVLTIDLSSLGQGVYLLVATKDGEAVAHRHFMKQ